MAPDDRENGLGHFRIGQWLMEAGQFEEAAASFRRTLELSPRFSKVFQLLGACLLKLGRRDEAARTLAEGWKAADENGDKMPRDEMGKLLAELGEPVPEPRRTEAAGPGTGFPCQRPICVPRRPARQL